MASAIALLICGIALIGLGLGAPMIAYKMSKGDDEGAGLIFGLGLIGLFVVLAGLAIIASAVQLLTGTNIIKEFRNG